MQEQARQVGLDEALVYGLIRQESRFVQQARSGIGASGLMQLMPVMVCWVAKRIGMKNFSQSLVNQLDTNVALGTYYLKYVLDKLDGQPLLATAAYNAGPRRAINWRSMTPMEGAIYAETIPFTETRGYVVKVPQCCLLRQPFGQPLKSGWVQLRQEAEKLNAVVMRSAHRRANKEKNNGEPKKICVLG